MTVTHMILDMGILPQIFMASAEYYFRIVLEKET